LTKEKRAIRRPFLIAKFLFSHPETERVRKGIGKNQKYAFFK
jgi:hypothetical protein